MIAPASPPAPLAQAFQRVRFTHVLPDVVFGDAVSNDCLTIARTLRDWGFVSDIYGERIDQRCLGDVRPIADYREGSDEIVVFHYSTWSKAAERLVRRGRRNVVLVYHNLTPERYFLAANPDAAENARRARAILPQLASVTLIGLGKSEYSRADLVAAGFEPTGVLPVLVPWDDLDGPADAKVLERLADGCVNVLSVGRLAPNKGIDDVLKAFYRFHQLQPRSRLLLVGSDTVVPLYREWLGRFAGYLNLGDAVCFAGRVDLPAWRAYYRAAHVYLCMSEHEGFCVPLLEAMHSGVPVLAYAAAAVPETLGDAGILLHRKDPVIAAEIVDMLVRDSAVRTLMIARGRARAASFARPRVESILAQHLATAYERAVATGALGKGRRR